MYLRKGFSKGNVESVCGLLGVCSGMVVSLELR
jgi:hypothetical protein